PVHLSEDERSAWGQSIGNYKIIPPFPQIGRAVHHLDPKEAQSRVFTGFPQTEIDTVALVSFLENTGWSRGGLGDAGSYDDYSKHFPSAQVTAVVVLNPGLIIGGASWAEKQQLRSCCFRELNDPNKHLILGKVDPVVISEVLGGLTALASQGS